MKVQDFLQHYGIGRNPFYQEDAQEDPVFSDGDGCSGSVKHAAWDKIFGSPTDPASAVVFGEKGSGKTALRLQMTEEIRQHNQQRPDRRVFLIEYDDFNPFLDTFTRSVGTLDKWELHDHIDSILSLSVRRLVDQVLSAGSARRGDPIDPDAITPASLKNLSRLEKRDLMLLGAIYDRSAGMSTSERFRRLQRKLRFRSPGAGKPTSLAVLVTLLLIVGLAALAYFMFIAHDNRVTTITHEHTSPRVVAAVAVGLLVVAWIPVLISRFVAGRRAALVRKHVRVLDPASPAVRREWRIFSDADLTGQPIHHLESTDARYVLLDKFRGVLSRLGFTSIIVLVDRVDEPHAINGRADAIHELMRSIFDLKFLKHPGLGVKLLLPRELYAFVGRESPKFHERARLDKQNLIPNLEWSGEALYDLAAERLAACAQPTQAAVTAAPTSAAPAPEGSPAIPVAEARPMLRQFFDESISDQELTEMFDRLRTPRNLFKFLYQLLSSHAMKYTTERPSWKIDRETLNTTFALFSRDMERSSAGMPTG